MAIYMDTAASTLPSHAVINTLNQTVNIYANPSSIHDYGQEARYIIDNATDIIANELNCLTQEINYTSGATMSNSLAIQGWLRKNPSGVLFVSSIEHNDIMMLAEYLKNHGKEVIYINVRNDGKLSLNDLIVNIKKYVCTATGNRPFLLSCQMANSEVGIIQDMNRIAEIVHFYGGILHTDATQYIPHFPMHLSGEHKYIDMFSMSGQKINCIKGTGILFIRSGIEIDPIIFGEQGLIGGTENVIGISCLGASFKELSIYNHDIENREELLVKQSKLINCLSDIGVLVPDCECSRLPNNVAMIFKNINGENLVQLLNDEGIYVSSGSACSSYIMKPSHVLKAMGYSDEEASSCVRFTIDNTITYNDINYVSNKIHKIIMLLS